MYFKLLASYVSSRYHTNKKIAFAMGIYSVFSAYNSKQDHLNCLTAMTSNWTIHKVVKVHMDIHTYLVLVAKAA